MTTVSIGIPAYNEEGNIAVLLKALLAQTQRGFHLSEIIVVSDASRDKTVTRIKDITSNRIRLIENKKRLGQAQSQNLILKRFSGDILVLLNADVLPQRKDYLQCMIAPLLRSSRVGLVSSLDTPQQPTTIVESLLLVSLRFKKRLFSAWRDGNNLYTCIGRTRAFSRTFAKQFSWPQVMAEDAYSYLACVRKGFTYVYTPQAQVRYKLPSHIADHWKQSRRFFSSQHELYKFFPRSFVDREYHLPRLLVIKTFMTSLTDQPLYVLAYLGLAVCMRIASVWDVQPTPIWESARSSKVLKNI
jgi:glycosyltransferase involved in cell wall biosynthesis